MNYRRACRLAHRALQLARPRPVSLSAHPASQRTLSTPAPGSLSDVDEHDDFADFGRYSIILPPEPHVFGVSHIRPRRVPAHIARPPYVTTPPPGDGSDGDPRIGDGTVALGSVEERKLRAAAQLAKQVLDYAGSLVKPGVMTDKIDAQVHEYIIVRGAYPSPLLYSGFPKSCCTSVNNIIAHGIPDGRPLENGDIVNIDITVYLEGYHGDTSRTFLVGDVDNYGRELVAAATAALDAGISVCGPGRPFRAIGAAIHDALLRAAAASRTEAEYSVSPLFTGHGIGTTFHRPPWIVHERNDEPGTMRPGQCFTIEPCIVQGADPSGWIFPDGWTASTENAARSAQAEHMVLITETGADVLTRPLSIGVGRALGRSPASPQTPFASGRRPKSLNDSSDYDSKGQHKHLILYPTFRTYITQHWRQHRAPSPSSRRRDHPLLKELREHARQIHALAFALVLVLPFLSLAGLCSSVQPLPLGQHWPGFCKECKEVRRHLARHTPPHALRERRRLPPSLPSLTLRPARRADRATARTIARSVGVSRVIHVCVCTVHSTCGPHTVPVEIGLGHPHRELGDGVEQGGLECATRCRRAGLPVQGICRRCGQGSSRAECPGCGYCKRAGRR